MKLLICGIPCSGKTALGDWLRDHYAYAHVNLEYRIEGQQETIPPRITCETTKWLASLSDNVVVTWAFTPCYTDKELLRAFESSGFIPWWLAGDMDVARARCMKRDGEFLARKTFDIQANRLRLADSEIGTLFKGRMLHVISADEIWEPEAVAYQLLNCLSDLEYKNCEAA